MSTVTASPEVVWPVLALAPPPAAGAGATVTIREASAVLPSESVTTYRVAVVVPENDSSGSKDTLPSGRTDHTPSPGTVRVRPSAESRLPAGSAAATRMRTVETSHDPAEPSARRPGT